MCLLVLLKHWKLLQLCSLPQGEAEMCALYVILGPSETLEVAPTIILASRPSWTVCPVCDYWAFWNACSSSSYDASPWSVIGCSSSVIWSILLWPVLETFLRLRGGEKNWGWGTPSWIFGGSMLCSSSSFDPTKDVILLCFSRNLTRLEPMSWCLYALGTYPAFWNVCPTMLYDTLP